MTMACEMRCPWYCLNERTQRVYLVLSRVVCLAATRASCRRKRAGCGRAGGLAEPAEDLGDERDDLLAAREGIGVVAMPLRHEALACPCPRRRGRHRDP